MEQFFESDAPVAVWPQVKVRVAGDLQGDPDCCATGSDSCLWSPAGVSAYPVQGFPTLAGVFGFGFMWAGPPSDGGGGAADAGRPFCSGTIVGPEEHPAHRPTTTAAIPTNMLACLAGRDILFIRDSPTRVSSSLCRRRGCSFVRLRRDHARNSRTLRASLRGRGRAVVLNRQIA
jgi:hypothetical protein